MGQVTIRESGDVTIIEVAGRLDISALDEVRPELVAAAKTAGTRLVVHMANVSFIDSSGLGALVALQKNLAHEGKLLLLAEVPAQARMVLRITHLEWLLTCYDSVEDALAA